MFEGFSRETSDFLLGIMLNNERSWFLAHKREYEQYVKVPFKALADDLLDLMRADNPEVPFVNHVTKIYRDARRLHGGGPYKDHLWFTVFTGERDMDKPAFWFEIGPDSYSYGMGFYMYHASDMEKYRGSIDANPSEFERLIKQFNRHKAFELCGEDYKKPKADRGELLNPWYNKRRLDLVRQGFFEVNDLGPDLPSKISDEFQLLMPIYHYLDKVCKL